MILQIIGGVFLVIIVLIVLIYFFFKIKFGKYLNMDVEEEPLSINLNEDVLPDWLNDKKALALVSELDELGYSSGPAYSIYEMKDVHLKSYFKKPLMAVVYSHKVAGVWADILIEEIDGKEYTYSNAPMGGGMDNRPECVKEFRPTANLSELHALAEEAIKDSKAEMYEVDENNFREYFEAAYKKDVIWKQQKGGITFEEFSTIEEEAPFSTSKENIEHAFVKTKLDEMKRWHVAALQEYQKSENIKDEDFYEFGYKLVIVPFTSNATAFLEYLEERGFMSEIQLEKLVKLYSKDTDMEVLFEKINKLLSPKLRAEEVGKCSFPLELKIYRMSDEMTN